MSKIVEIVSALEQKIAKMLHKIKQLEAKNEDLERKLDQSILLLKTQEEEKNSLQKELEHIKMASALLGSEEYKRDTKLKINSLIREIDYCIAQLSQ
ncbi:hypothetical protein [Flavobacterium croceum]|jgi:uncharacterized protein YhaN|uniref:Cell division protein ZapB n=1 Tax=Flavobacterium croceum DSM 17960 TaxID=1121886 RepID=A0A2S4N7X6_9FLAO|nr:hypothetical protein [Flavobacterium croceum]POS01802.1 hypothetical protein Q361_108133 [Flavobacterium croceum DSM 17960]